jgi:hypothetical protein
VIRIAARHVLQAGDFLVGTGGLGDLLPICPNPEVFPFR